MKAIAFEVTKRGGQAVCIFTPPPSAPTVEIELTVTELGLVFQAVQRAMRMFRGSEAKPGETEVSLAYVKLDA